MISLMLNGKIPLINRCWIAKCTSFGWGLFDYLSLCVRKPTIWVLTRFDKKQAVPEDD